jgi:hypothetical protein
MKSLFTFILVLATATTFGQAKISLDKKIYDFGTFKEGPDSTCVFNVKNEGTAPLIIVSVTKPCGCTTPSYTQAPIPPGGTGEIVVKYASDGHPGTFTKRLQVRTNDPKNDYFFITIRGNAIAKETFDKDKTKK